MPSNLPCTLLCHPCYMGSSSQISSPANSMPSARRPSCNSTLNVFATPGSNLRSSGRRGFVRLGALGIRDDAAVAHAGAHPIDPPPAGTHTPDQNRRFRSSPPVRRLTLCRLAGRSPARPPTLRHPSIRAQLPPLTAPTPPGHPRSADRSAPPPAQRSPTARTGPVEVHGQRASPRDPGRANAVRRSRPDAAGAARRTTVAQTRPPALPMAKRPPLRVTSPGPRAAPQPPQDAGGMSDPRGRAFLFPSRSEILPATSSICRTSGTGRTTTPWRLSTRATYGASSWILEPCSENSSEPTDGSSVPSQRCCCSAPAIEKPWSWNCTAIFFQPGAGAIPFRGRALVLRTEPRLTPSLGPCGRRSLSRKPPELVQDALQVRATACTRRVTRPCHGGEQAPRRSRKAH